MEYVFGAAGGIYVWGVIILSIVFWFKKTDRSQAPVTRRVLAMGYGLIWPIIAFQYFTGKEKASAREAERRAEEQRILGGASTPRPSSSPLPQPRPAPDTSQSKIHNPFDDL